MVRGLENVSDSETTSFDAWRSLAETGEFEPVLAALEASVAKLEKGGLSLATMTECYELGLKLSRRCSELLRTAELRITMLDQEYAEQIADHAADEDAEYEPLAFLDEDE